MKGNALRTVLHLVFKHKAVVILLLILTMMAGIVVTLLMKPVYEASAKVLVKMSWENVYMAKGSQTATDPLAYDAAKDERINSEVEIIKGRNLTEHVLRNMGVERIFPSIGDERLLALVPCSRPLTPFEKAVYVIGEESLDVRRIAQSDVIEIRFAHENPFIAAQFVNTLIKVYLEHHQNVYKQSGGPSFLDEQAAFLKTKMKGSQASLKTFSRKNNITVLEDQRRSLIREIPSLESDMRKTSSDISKYEGKLISLKESGGTKLATEIIGREAGLDPEPIITLRKKLMHLRNDEEDLLKIYPQDSIFPVILRREMKKVRDRLDKEERAYHQMAVNTVQHILSTLRGKKARQTEQIRQHREKMERLNVLSRKYKEMKRQVEIDMSNYRLHIRHMEQARVSNATDIENGADIRIVEDAVPPIRPVRPIIWLNLLLSGIAGVIVGIGSVVLISRFDHHFQDAEDIQRCLDLPVLASIPEFESTTMDKGAG